MQTPLESSYRVMSNLTPLKTKEFELFLCQYLKNNICDIRLIHIVNPVSQVLANNSHFIASIILPRVVFIYVILVNLLSLSYLAWPFKSNGSVTVKASKVSITIYLSDRLWSISDNKDFQCDYLYFIWVG